MNMRIAEELTLRRIPRVSEDEIPRSEILVHGSPVGKIILGATLGAAVQWRSFYLLLLTDDVPFEEMLRVIVFDSQWNQLDSAVIGNIYSTGWLSALELSEPNRVYFDFIGDIRWSVELLARPKFRMPFFMEPYGVWRSFNFSRHFIVRGDPYLKVD